MYQLLVSGNQQHSEEQVWVMQLLAAGLRGPLDAQLYRSAHLYSYCVIASSTVCMLSYSGQSNCGPSVVLLQPPCQCSSCTGHLSHRPSVVQLHPRLFHIARGLSLTHQN